MTRFESLEELSAEVKLKHLLWDSLEEWKHLQNSWMQVRPKSAPQKVEIPSRCFCSNVPRRKKVETISRCLCSVLPLQSHFSALEPEHLSTQVNKYMKSVSQLEKGLPPNSVVPNLKHAVESIREKVNPPPPPINK